MEKQLKDNEGPLRVSCHWQLGPARLSSLHEFRVIGWRALEPCTLSAFLDDQFSTLVQLRTAPVSEEFRSALPGVGAISKTEAIRMSVDQ